MTMIIRYLFLSLFFLSLSAQEYSGYFLAATESDPSTLVEGCVSAITGDYFISEKDIEVTGVEPIYFKRIYLSGLSDSGNGGWRTDNYHFASCRWTRNPFISGVREAYEYTLYLSVKEPSGVCLWYLHGGESRKKKDQKNSIHLHMDPLSFNIGLVNSANQEISGRYNLKNNRVGNNKLHIR